MNLFPILVILFAQSFSSLELAATSLNDHHNIDHAALLKIKSKITADPSGLLNSWNDSTNICQWHGVTCDPKNIQRKRVVGLNLTSNGLVGTLSPAIGNLSFLQRLSLYNNSFHGHIPSEIGYLSDLTSLLLESNSFDGNIPDGIGRCKNLTYFIIDQNKFSGKIPSSFYNLSSLVYMSLSYNHFEGSLPVDIGFRFPRIQRFIIDQNKFSGKIPSSFYNLSSLVYMSLSNNHFEGSLPMDIGFRFPRIQNFRIGNNSFHGNVPFSLSNLTDLVELDITHNNFTGNFTFSGKKMSKLQCIHINNNFLGTGWEGDLSFLRTLANCTQLQRISCGFNNFGGKFPSNFVGNSTKLTFFDFRSNRLTGNIPLWLFDLTSLEEIHLEQNELTGDLPPKIGKLSMLERFYCSNNNLVGYIPHSLGNLPKLSELYLSKNNFEGTIPSTLGNCTNLISLSLSDNNLRGTVPYQLFQASMLVYLSVSQNHLQGNLPREIESLQSLQTLDVSENNFSGEIPGVDSGSLLKLNVLEMGGNYFTGVIPESFKSLINLEQLNLSHNKLVGRIPSFFSNFSMTQLDLSFNNFKGEVPKGGVFANASVVSVSGNPMLCGGDFNLHLPKCRDRKWSIKLVLLTVAASLTAVVFMVSSIYLLCSKKKKNKLSHESSSKETFSKVSYDMLLKATNHFSDANLLGKGSFGSVYKGILDLETSNVAIKVMNLENEGARKSFIAECNALRNIRHRNLLKIVTACSSVDFNGNDFKALVYEFMSNGNLQQWIHSKHLSLVQRLNIAIDVACAVDYLHNSCEVPIIHCDLKPSNILVDKDMVAHVGDFGLARFHSHKSTSSSIAVKGTVGYAPPEYGLGSMVSKEGDVYSYGILLIEMMTTKSPAGTTFDGCLNLHQYTKSAFPDQLQKIIDPKLVFNNNNVNANANANASHSCEDFHNEYIKSMIEIGLKCSMDSPQDRMSVSDALKVLQSTRDIFVGAGYQHNQNEHEIRVAL